MKEILERDINEALSKVTHPEIDYSLVDLGMITDIASKENKVRLTLNLPFFGVPIKEHLIQTIEKTLTDLDKAIKVDINLKEMNVQKREEFMKKAKEKWKP